MIGYMYMSLIIYIYDFGIILRMLCFENCFTLVLYGMVLRLLDQLDMSLLFTGLSSSPLSVMITVFRWRDLTGLVGNS